MSLTRTHKELPQTLGVGWVRDFLMSGYRVSAFIFGNVVLQTFTLVGVEGEQLGKLVQ